MQQEVYGHGEGHSLALPGLLASYLQDPRIVVVRIVEQDLIVFVVLGDGASLAAFVAEGLLYQLSHYQSVLCVEAEELRAVLVLRDERVQLTQGFGHEVGYREGLGSCGEEDVLLIGFLL
jgi:hypothetical protein